MALWILPIAGFVTAVGGTLSGVGGAVLLVPALVIAGMSPLEAAPLGLLSVAAGSMAAAPRHLRDGLVHHRLGVVVEIAASVGALLGAALSVLLAPAVLTRVLGVSALAAGVASVLHPGMRNRAVGAFSAEEPGEWAGTFGGSYRLGDRAVPYEASRLRVGVGLMGGAGVIAGLVGAGGGFIKTPVLREVMRVPMKVAAATSTYTLGLTAVSALVVFALQGRVDPVAGAAIVAGSLVGGITGSRLQALLSPTLLRFAMTGLLLVVGVVLVVRG